MAIPLRGRTSSEIAKALHDHLITQHGPPITILSDRGRELISKAMQHLCQYWEVRKVATGGYNPTGNAFCERFHRYLNCAMTTLKPGSAESPEWDRLVPAVLFSYRCSINDATGFSPYYMLHGKDPHLPDDLLFQVKEQKLEFVADYVDTIQSNLKSAFELSLENSNTQLQLEIENELQRKIALITNLETNFMYGKFHHQKQKFLTQRQTTSLNCRKNGLTNGLALSILLNGFQKEAARLTTMENRRYILLTA